VIPKADIVAWRQTAPWIADAQVEQDLIISRVLVTLYGNQSLADRLAFRGGTALHKLYFRPPRRYSEDIDLVQVIPEPIGTIFDMVQEVANPFLGTPKRKQAADAVTLTYRIESEGPPVISLRVKIEINTREHFTVSGLQKKPFEVRSRWFNGTCHITTFPLEELLATKLRALYQRRKGRDLFDLWLGITEGQADVQEIVRIFTRYMEHEGNVIDGRSLRANVLDKLKHPGFTNNLRPLLPAGIDYNPEDAGSLILQEIIARMHNGG
jgi:predicted nucleotidyltransferase component of viral defense system